MPELPISHGPGPVTPPAPIEHPSVRHEKTDANFRAILSILIGAAVFAVVMFLGITWFFYSWEAHEDADKRSPYPLAPGPSDALPEGPRLEQVERLPPPGQETDAAKANVYERQSSREDYLNSYGNEGFDHTPMEKGFVHIPIERAMTLLEGKLPARAERPADQTWRADGLLDSGESNSGRLFRGKP